jgi:hypothetical protein
MATWFCDAYASWQKGGRVLASGARFGCVLADAEYGRAAEFRAGLAERRLAYAVGVPPVQQVYPADVTLAFPERKPTGRPRKHPVPSAASVARPSCSRPGRGRSAPSPGAPAPRGRSGPSSRPSGCAWPTARSRREGGTCRARRRGSSASIAPPASASTTCPNLPPDATLEALAALIKARWVCEQMHQQLKGELGLGHFEGRSWRGLHHHALLCQLAFAFLQHLRLGGKSVGTPPEPGPPPRPSLPAVRRRIAAALTRTLLSCPHCRQRFEHHLRP